MGTVVQLKNQINDSYFQLKNSVEDKLQQSGRGPSQSHLAEMDALWDEVKREEKTSE